LHGLDRGTRTHSSPEENFQNVGREIFHCIAEFIAFEKRLGPIVLVSLAAQNIPNLMSVKGSSYLNVGLSVNQ
jgi:hypothetical protein